MAQIFHRSFNTLSRVSIFGAVFILAFSLGRNHAVETADKRRWTQMRTATEASFSIRSRHHFVWCFISRKLALLRLPSAFIGFYLRLN